MELKIQNVSMTYPSGKQALKGLNLDLKSPSLIGLLGPNGAGKSTLMKLLVAALMPTEGSILVDGAPLNKVEGKLKASLGYLPQDFGLFEELTVTQFLDYMAALKGLRSPQAAIRDVIRAVNLEEKARARIRTLSGGQRQRVGIAQALLGDPTFLIFDEPTVGLDPEERIHFRNLFSPHRPGPSGAAQHPHHRGCAVGVRPDCGHQPRADPLYRHAGAADRVSRRPCRRLLGEGRETGAGPPYHRPGEYQSGRPVPGRGGPAAALCPGRGAHAGGRLPLSDLPGGGTMKTMRLFPLELQRLLQSRLTWLIMALTVLSPVLGLVFYKPATSTTMLSMYLANPAIAGGVAGAILFGLLAIFELDRARRSRVDILTDAVVSPLTTALTRLLALLTAAVLTVGLTMLVWLPISAGLIGSVFTGANYVLAYLLLMGLALPLGILAAAAAYQFTRRTDLSIVLFIAFCALSITVWADDWQLCWLNPCVWALSDDFSNFRVFRSVAWMRLTWLAALVGVWTISYLCIRQYGKGIFGSLARSVRRIYRPAVALALLACSGTAYAAQPFIDNSNPDLTVMSFYEIPYAEGVTFLSRSAQVFPDTDAGTVTGRASYQFQHAI